MRQAKMAVVIAAMLLLASLALSVPQSLVSMVNNNNENNPAASGIASLYQSSVINALQCEDTDSSSFLDAGRVYSVQGTSSGKYAGTETEGSWIDYCRNDFELVEYFCGSGQNKVKFNKITCLAGCQDGACISPPYCFDMDSGTNDKVRGSIFIINSGVNELVSGLTPTQDSCQDANTLIKYYCDPESAIGINSQAISCQYGCSGGKCLRNPPAVVQAAPEEASEAQPASAPSPSGAITLTPGQAVTINGKGVTLNSQLNSLTVTETAKLYLGSNQIDGVTFTLVSSGTASSSSASSTSGGGTFGLGSSGGSVF